MAELANPPVEMVQLLGTHKAPKELYELVRLQGKHWVRRRNFWKEYKAQDFVDPDLWDISVALNILIGRCIAHLVATNQLELRFAGCPRCTNKRYLRI